MFDYIAFKNYLAERGIKQSFIAQKIGISDGVMSALTVGRIKCDLEKYVDICKALAVPFGTFLNIDDSPLTKAD